MVYRAISLLVLAGIIGCRTARSAPPPSPEAVELARVERQLEEFYGPMLFLLEESRISIEDVLQLLGREYVFPVEEPFPEDERRFWLFRAENDFMPRNERMAALAVAKGDLVEGEDLKKFLKDLIQHQDSWRKLHRRWKEKGVAYAWHSDTPFPRRLGDEVQEGFARLKIRHAELLRKVPGAELRFVERQLAEIYEPLAKLNLKGREEFNRLLDELGRRYVFALSEDRYDEELKLWWKYCEKHFFPNNDERLRLMSQLHLLEGDRMPQGFLDYVDHWYTWKIAHLRWKKEQVKYSWHSKRNYARGLNQEVEAGLRTLRARRQELQGT